MSEDNKKIIIGLTGNIATGKSVVRELLENLGAYGIDADILAHRAIEKKSPGYQKVINEFGSLILGPDLEIDRNKLSEIVFSNPAFLEKLELIIHPLVRSAVKFLIKNTDKRAVVIEAIKLIESPLIDIVDTVWVTISSEDQQIERLIEKRGIEEEQARKIMNMQSPQDEKIKSADTIIINDRKVDGVLVQVQSYWEELFPEDQVIDPKGILLSIIRGTPKHSKEIISFINRIDTRHNKFDEININQFFGDRAYFLIMANAKIVGVVGWRVENLISRIEEIWIDINIVTEEVVLEMFNNIEQASKELQAEVILVLVDLVNNDDYNILNSAGFQIQDIGLLQSKAWKKIAKDFGLTGKQILFKPLFTNNLMSQL